MNKRKFRKQTGKQMKKTVRLNSPPKRLFTTDLRQTFKRKKKTIESRKRKRKRRRQRKKD